MVLTEIIGLQVAFFAQIQLQMHIIFYPVPRNGKSHAMRTEDRSGGVLQIFFRIVADGFFHFRCIVAWLITPDSAGKPSHSSGIGNHLALILPHTGYRCRSGKYCRISFRNWKIKASLHLLHIRHCTPDTVCRKLQPKIIPGF